MLWFLNNRTIKFVQPLFVNLRILVIDCLMSIMRRYWDVYFVCMNNSVNVLIMQKCLICHFVNMSIFRICLICHFVDMSILRIRLDLSCFISLCQYVTFTFLIFYLVIMSLWPILYFTIPNCNYVLTFPIFNFVNFDFS